MTVDDAHAIVRNVLEGVEEGGTPGLHELRLADLNETEREHAVAALKRLQDLDEALAQRSEFNSVGRPAHADHGGDA